MDLFKLYFNQIKYLKSQFSISHTFLLHKFILERSFKVLLNKFGLFGGQLLSVVDDVAEIKLLRKSLLGDKNSIVYIPKDNAITISIIRNGYWEKREVSHIRKVAAQCLGEVTLIDLGAHAGLVSLQTLNSSSQIHKCILVEPEPLHIRCIKLNFRERTERIEIHEKALAIDSGTQIGYSDLNNRGNFTLEQSAASELKFPIRVDTDSAKSLSRNFLQNPGTFILKSDLQGYDSEVLNEFVEEFWKRTKGCVVEVWSLPSIDKESTSELVRKWSENFSFWETGLMDFEPRIRVTPESLLHRWLDGTGRYTNLFLSK